ncbi:hypothetical protein C823_006777 [Eubacterium plexicaudatum ASF492]|uniref:Uracil-DNA glycosylase, family 4 n=1 Tax=Eubacterium plexicaudatum ASF492 TaxID=1235802 RepID=N2A377_9FIRM|nr:hypothetical protein C823_006777 [Eubacterium plexicaudatum ASF492]
MRAFETINELKHVLFASYSKNTAYHKVKNNWNPFNRYVGQCVITSMIINRMFGGVILCGFIENLNINHYWNSINDTEIDLTIEQFTEKPHIVNIKTISFCELYDNENIRNRYEQLLAHVTDVKDRLDLLEDEIYRCSLCSNVDKFMSKTIHYGSNCNLLFIGEAPAKSGWRITGKVWTGSDGKIIPSGKVFEKLLQIIGLELFDASFTEAIKCYPSSGKVTATNNKYCEKHLNNLINILKPNLLVPMGTHAARNLLETTQPISQIAGKIYTSSKFEYNIRIMPIYHPSPISPMGYKNNIEIFENLKRIIKKSKENYDDIQE